MSKKFSYTTLITLCLIMSLGISFTTKTPISYARNIADNKIVDTSLRYAINQKIKIDRPQPSRRLDQVITSEDLKSLQGNLDASKTQISTIKPGAANISNFDGIEEATNLTGLNISGNRLYQMPEQIYSVTNLQTLNASKNNFLKLSNSISNFINLQTLELKDGELQDLPANIGNLANLKILDLRNNRLNSLPATIGDLTNLQILELSNNEIQELPQNIGNLANLQKLKISENNLQTLPDTIGTLHNLQKLTIQYNQSLRTLPNTIGDLRNLEELNVSKNSLQDLPNNIEQLTNLKTLNVSSNRLQQLPNSIGDLTNLETLDVSENALQTLPQNMESLKNLISLFLSNNDLRQIPENILSIKSLEEVDAESNLLTDLPTDINPDLDHINFSKNKLFNISNIGNVVGIEATEQKLSGGKITVNPSSDMEVCTNVTLPVRWDGQSVTPTQDAAYTFTATVGENPTRSGHICWHHVNLTSEAVQYFFETKTDLLGSKTFGGRVIFDLEENKNKIPDTNLQTVINQRLNINSSSTGASPKKKPRLDDDPITLSDLQSLHGVFDATNRNIKDLTGIQHATNLTLLDVSNNHISSLEPLNGAPFQIKAAKQTIENNQTLIILKQQTNNNLYTTNPVPLVSPKNQIGQPITPTTNNNYTIDQTNNIVWNNLARNTKILSYNFLVNLPNGKEFSGTINFTKLNFDTTTNKIPQQPNNDDSSEEEDHTPNTNFKSNWGAITTGGASIGLGILSLKVLKNTPTNPTISEQSLELQPLLDTNVASETTTGISGLVETAEGIEITTISTEGAEILATIEGSAAIGAETGTVAEPLIGTAIGAGIGVIVGVGIVIYAQHEYIQQTIKETWHNWFG